MRHPKIGLGVNLDGGEGAEGTVGGGRGYCGLGEMEEVKVWLDLTIFLACPTILSSHKD